MAKKEQNRQKKQDPAADRFDEVMSRIDAESDRAAVILAAAALDTLLLELLKSFLRPVPSGDDDLLEGDRPLSTFSSRIKVAHRLRLIDDLFAAALNLVRKVRNEFAHETGGHALAASPHRERVAEVVKLFRPIAPELEEGKILVLNGKSGPGADFRIAVAIMLVRLQSAVEEVEPVHDSQEVPLLSPHLIQQHRSRAPAPTKAPVVTSKPELKQGPAAANVSEKPTT